MARQCWVVAANDGFNTDVYFYKKKKTAVEDGNHVFRSYYFHSACELEFRRFTGLKMEPGKIVKVRFSGEILSK